MQLNDVENKAKMELDRLRSLLSQEETAAFDYEERAIRSQEGEPRRAGLYRNGGGTSRTDEEEHELDRTHGSEPVITVPFRNNTSLCSSSMTVSMRKAWGV